METKINPKQQELKVEEKVVRLLSKDIEGKLSLYTGLTKIKGISWAISNLICKKLGMSKTKKFGELTPQDIAKITAFAGKLEAPKYMMNRIGDFETNESKHLIGTDLELQSEFDIKRLKKIKSYRGLRHATGQPVRGQRTRSHFRKNRRKGSGIKKK